MSDNWASFPVQIPAHSKVGTDHYLILGVDNNGNLLVVDQDGDIRTMDYTNVQTEWVYLDDPGMWINRQLTLEDLEEADEAQPEAPTTAASGSESADDGPVRDDAVPDPKQGESGVFHDPGLD